MAFNAMQSISGALSGLRAVGATNAGDGPDGAGMPAAGIPNGSAVPPSHDTYPTMETWKDHWKE